MLSCFHMSWSRNENILFEFILLWKKFAFFFYIYVTFIHIIKVVYYYMYMLSFLLNNVAPQNLYTPFFSTPKNLTWHNVIATTMSWHILLYSIYFSGTKFIQPTKQPTIQTFPLQCPSFYCFTLIRKIKCKHE